MGDTNSPSVAHVGYVSWGDKYRIPRATEGESICLLCCRLSYLFGELFNSFKQHTGI